MELATKFGIIASEDGKFGFRADPEYVRSACEASLRRLGVTSIDLYYQHRIDTTVPIEVTVTTASWFQFYSKLVFKVIAYSWRKKGSFSLCDIGLTNGLMKLFDKDGRVKEASGRR